MMKALIPTGFGLNCDYETEHILKLAGADTKRVHLQDLYDRRVRLTDYQLIAFIGGFAFGDENGAGVVLADDVNTYLDDQLQEVIEKGRLVLGTCNGFQAIVKKGLLPGNEGYDKRDASLTYNDCGRFRDDWVTVRINKDSPCVFTDGIDYMDLPIRHGEGKFVCKDDNIEKRLSENGQIVMQYCMWQTQELADGRFPDNPNGSKDDIAGICDPTGRVFGLMPHPESYNHYTNHPTWTREIDKKPAGIKIFENAVRYFS